jgi:hypothetical protein
MTYGRGESFVQRIERLSQRSLNDGAAAEQRQADRIARAVEALESVQAKFATVVNAGSGCFEMGQPQAAGAERSSLFLSWRPTKPQRTLTITADLEQGKLLWQLSRDDSRQVFHEGNFDPLNFDASDLDEMIFILIDHDAWNKEPTFTGPPNFLKFADDD